jgi:radical SAM-linked protein
MALLSHLDTVRMLERALRRSGLPVSFSGGFHPLPRLQLALALPLGVEAGADWLDLEFASRVDPEQALAALRCELPPGFLLERVVEVPVGGPSLSQELAAAEWTLELSAVDPAPELGTERWEAAIAALLAAEALPWSDTDKKGRPRQRDGRPFLLGLELLGPLDAATGPVSLRLRAAIDGQGRSLRPDQLAHWLQEELGVALRLGRLRRERLILRDPLQPAGSGRASFN